MKKRNTKYLYLILVSILFSLSCKKNFEEINKNPNGFTEASDGSLFNAAISSLQSGWDEQLYVNVSVLYKEIQLTALPQVRWSNYTLGTEDIWSNYYTTLPNLRELEKRFSVLDTTDHGVKNMMAMEKILLAYKTFKVTDLFGDIPFSQSGYGFQDASMTHPPFESQESIYKNLLNELAWAAENIDVKADTADPFITFKNFDNLFYGDLEKWQKFANSLRLRYAMRMVNKEPMLAAQIIQDIIENHKPAFGVNDFGQLVSEPNTQTALLYPYRLGYRNESKCWSFDQSEHARMGTNMWHLLSSNDNIDGSGIFDPRAYYFFETSYDSSWIPFPNVPATAPPDGGAPYKYPDRDVNYSLKGAGCLYSPVNYYLVRDMDYQPDILMTGSEVLFLRAEAYLRGIGVTKDVDKAYSALRDGIQFSVDFWGHVMDNSKLPTTGTAFSTNIDVPSGLGVFTIESNNGGAVYSNYYSGNDQDKLKIIYAQCMIDLFRQPQEAFALARRTMNTPREGSEGLKVYRFTIPPSEVAYNQANWLSVFGSSGDDLMQKVWWMY